MSSGRRGWLHWLFALGLSNRFIVSGGMAPVAMSPPTAKFHWVRGTLTTVFMSGLIGPYVIKANPLEELARRLNIKLSEGSTK